MRSTIEIDDRLLMEAMHITKFATKKELINAGLEELVRSKRIERLVNRLGKSPLKLTLKDLNKMRENG